MASALQTTLTALKAARDSGAASVTVDGVTTTFRSQKELKELIASIERQLGRRRPRVRTRGVYMGHR